MKGICLNDAMKYRYWEWTEGRKEGRKEGRGDNGKECTSTEGKTGYI